MPYTLLSLILTKTIDCRYLLFNVRNNPTVSDDNAFFQTQNKQIPLEITSKVPSTLIIILCYSERHSSCSV